MKNPSKGYFLHTKGVFYSEGLWSNFEQEFLHNSDDCSVNCTIEGEVIHSLRSQGPKKNSLRMWAKAYISYHFQMRPIILYSVLWCESLRCHLICAVGNLALEFTCVKFWVTYFFYMIGSDRFWCIKGLFLGCLSNPS